MLDVLFSGLEKIWKFFPESQIRLCSIPDPGSEFFSILDAGSASKNLSIITQKWFLWFLRSRKYDPGCSSRIRTLTFYPFRIQGSKRHRIPDPDLQHWLQLTGDERQWSRRADNKRTWASPHHGQDVGALAALHLGFKQANFHFSKYCSLNSGIDWSYRYRRYHIECGYVGVRNT